jgi:hypothetical protein
MGAAQDYTPRHRSFAGAVCGFMQRCRPPMLRFAGCSAPGPLGAVQIFDYPGAAPLFDYSRA